MLTAVELVAHGKTRQQIAKEIGADEVRPAALFFFFFFKKKEIPVYFYSFALLTFFS